MDIYLIYFCSLWPFLFFTAADAADAAAGAATAAETIVLLLTAAGGTQTLQQFWPARHSSAAQDPYAMPTRKQLSRVIPTVRSDTPRTVLTEPDWIGRQIRHP